MSGTTFYREKINENTLTIKVKDEIGLPYILIDISDDELNCLNVEIDSSQGIDAIIYALLEAKTELAKRT